MPDLELCGASAFVFAHGVVHLLWVAAYWPLTTIDGLPYKTTLFSGRWDAGARGMRAYSAAWIVPTVGFVAGALALVADLRWAEPYVVVVALVAILISLPDLWQAKWGALIDAAIIAVIAGGLL